MDVLARTDTDDTWKTVPRRSTRRTLPKQHSFLRRLHARPHDNNDGCTPCVLPCTPARHRTPHLICRPYHQNRPLLSLNWLTSRALGPPTSPSALTRETSLASVRSERPLRTPPTPTRTLALHLPPPPAPELPHQHTPSQKQPKNTRRRRSIQRGKRPMKDTANSVVPRKKAHQLLVGPPDIPGSSSSHARYNDYAANAPPMIMPGRHSRRRIL
jgi:hypothetical protein